MIRVKSNSEIEIMNQTGNALAGVYLTIASEILPGISTLKLDQLIEKELKRVGLVSQSKGYMGYKYASCISINDEVVHGVPSAQHILKQDDLVKIDICAKRDGYCADMSRMFFLGTTQPKVAHFMQVACDALEQGIAKARAGNHLSDISAAIQGAIDKHGYGIIRDFAGHGIGRTMHEDPEILNYGTAGRGPLLKEGMTLALEPMIAMGAHDVYIADDGWTVRTSDKSLAAHVEDTIAVTDDEPRVLTRIDKSYEGIQN